MVRVTMVEDDDCLKYAPSVALAMLGFPPPPTVDHRMGFLALVGDGSATNTITNRRNQSNRLPLTVTKLSSVKISPNEYDPQGAGGRHTL